MTNKPTCDSVMVSGDRTTLDALVPDEMWDEVVSFLTGWELFNLMRVCRDAYALFSDVKWWQARCSPASSHKLVGTAGANLRQYMAQQSFAFVLDDASKQASSAKTGPGPVALTAAFSIPFVFGRDSRAVTIEIWFALCGASDGGILLGAGTPFHVSPSWNPLFETWIHVDDDGNLYGSLLVPTATDGKKLPVARNLARDRWHQIVITFETIAAVVTPIPGAGADRDNWRMGEERVYVNGELATFQRGSLSRFWIFNSFVLLGTGCNSQAAAQSGAGKQWFPFQGVVDDMRVWHTVLSPHAIQSLANHQLHSDTIPSPIHSWKLLATAAAPMRRQDHSIEFRGSHDTRPHSRGVSVNVVSRSNFQRGLMEDRLEFHPFCPDKSSSFAIEVWFYLLPEDDANWGGGVILGAQSRDVSDAYSPSRTRQLIYVDRHGRLYASVLDEIMFPSAQRLAPHRWYHLVLRYQDGKQDVYLNGVAKRFSHGALLRDWQTLSHMQVGTGCVNNTRGAPKGWYGFHGRIRDVRIWGPRLRDKQFTTILESSTATRVGTVRHIQPVFSLQKDGRLPHFVCVQNSRPHERLFVPRLDGARDRLSRHRHGSGESEPEREGEASLKCSHVRLAEPPLPHQSPSSKWLRSMWHKARTTLTSS